MKIYSTLLLFLCYSSLTWAIDLGGNIRGIVTNFETGQIIPGATIKLEFYSARDKNKTIVKSYSQDAGEFIFKNVEPGIYNLECTAFGFKTTRIIGLQVREDRTKLAYFKLERGPAAEIQEVYTYAAIEAKQKAAIETGSTTKESIEDAPATVYVVTADEIASKGYIGLNELLMDIPEFEIQNRATSEEYNVVSARGVYGNEKLLILIDGVRYNSMVSTKFALVENYNIRYADRVEVMLGPASALYGADAYMGVINIITKRGNKAKGFSLTNSYGLYNTTSNAFYLGVGNDDLSFSMSGGLYYSDGAKLNELYPKEFDFYNNTYLKTGEILTSHLDSTNSTQTLPIKPFDINRFSYFIEAILRYKGLSFSFHHNQEQHSSAVSEKGEYAPYWADARFGSSLSVARLEYLYRPKKSKKWFLKSLFNASLMFITVNSKFVNTFTEYQDGYKLGADAGGRLTETFQYTFNKYNKLAVGLTLQHSLTTPTTSAMADPRSTVMFPFKPFKAKNEGVYYLGTDHVDSTGKSLKIYQNVYNIRRVIAGVFAEYKLNIKDKLLMTLGARLDYIIDISEHDPAKPVRTYNSFNPRLGLVYKPVENFNIKLFYGEGFLQPPPQRKYEHFGTFHPVKDSSGNYTHISGGFWRLPNEDLAPEKVRTTELSAKYTKGDLSIAANGYFNFIENALIFEKDYNNPTFQGISITASERTVNSTVPVMTYGATLRADYRLFFGAKEQIKLKLNGSYTFANGIVNGLQHLPFTAQHTIKGGVLLRIHNFSFNNSVIYRSASYNNGYIDADNNRVQQGNPAFFVWNVFAQYRLLNKKRLDLTVFCKVSNILNSRYYHTTDNGTIALGASPQDPIRFEAGLSVKFGG